MRLLILFGLVYLAYRILKFWILQDASSHKTVADPGVREIDDVMIKDPFCNVYFARKKGIHLKFEGEDLYFCSTECKDQFVALKTKSMP